MNQGQISRSDSSGSLDMIDVEPEYFKEQVSSEIKDRAKENGLVFFDRERWKIVLTDDPDKYMEALEAFGLNQYLRMRITGVL